MAYKDLLSSLDEKGQFNSKECIKGTFIDPSLGSVAQNYINTADKYGSRIYPLDFTKGKIQNFRSVVYIVYSIVTKTHSFCSNILKRLAIR